MFHLGINCVHEPPRRVLIELPNSNITLSDYLFPGEGPEDAKLSLEELLGIEIKGKLKIQDVEGQTGQEIYNLFSFQFLKPIKNILFFRHILV